jgi:hypothetical protein
MAKDWTSINLIYLYGSFARFTFLNSLIIDEVDVKPAMKQINA